MEHRKIQNSLHLPRSWVRLIHQRMLRHQIIVRKICRFRQPRRPRTKQPRRRRAPRPLQIVEVLPIRFAVLEQIGPLLETFRRRFAVGIEDDDIRLVDAVFIRGFEDVLQHVRLREDEFDSRRLQGVREFVRRVRRIDAGEHGPAGDEAMEEDGVVDIVEGIYADAVASLDTERAEPGHELTDEFECLTGGDGVGGVITIDVDWLVPVVGEVVEGPRGEVFGWNWKVVFG